MLNLDNNNLYSLSVSELEALLAQAKAREKQLADKESFEAEIASLAEDLSEICTAIRALMEAQRAIEMITPLFTAVNRTEKGPKARARAMPTTSIADDLRRDSGKALLAYLESAYGEDWRSIQVFATWRTVTAALYKAILQAKQDPKAESLSQGERIDRVSELVRLQKISKSSRGLGICVCDLLHQFGFVHVVDDLVKEQR